ncbi:MAG TPA: GNAT family N-acetyltransferase [Devosia sp.]|nr:GNAT family N-acetyltransferase [Devosia sp.]
MRSLLGNGVTLEPQEASHAAELYFVISDPELYRFTDNKEPASVAALRERLQRLESRRSPDGRERWLNWVVRNSESQLVGYVQATVAAGGSAEIAYVFGRAHWRRGYAYAACVAMVNELRVHYGVSRITATLDPANTASVALLGKLGLVEVWSNTAEEEVGYALELTD